jgi:hypothetical protein
VTIKPKPGSIGGILERKFEKLLVLGAISTGCNDATAKAIQDRDPHAIAAYYRALNQSIDFLLTRVIQMCAETLKNPDNWRDLANKPADFNKALDKVTRGASIALKLLHRIPDHRPSEHEKRDQELYRLKMEHAEWSFGQLANQYNLNYAHDRRFERRSTRLIRAVVEQVSSIFAAASPS